VLLVLALLGGGLVCLLVINTTLGATSFQIDHLQHAVNARLLQAQQLQNQLARDESDAKIEQEACHLGMRPRQRLEFLDLRTQRFRSSTPVTPSPAWCAPAAPAARAAQNAHSKRTAHPRRTGPASRTGHSTRAGRPAKTARSAGAVR